MTMQYWVVGADFEECDFSQAAPGSASIHGPFADETKARTEWQRLTFRDHVGATRRYAIATAPITQ